MAARHGRGIELGAQSLPSTVEQHLDGRQARLYPFGDLLVREPRDLTEQEDLLLLAGERTESAPERVSLLVGQPLGGLDLLVQRFLTRT